jgi:transcriptional regulator with XRE-family HTH domain
MERDFRLDWQLLVDEAARRRKKLGLTQKRLGELAGVSTPTVSRFEQAAKDLQLSSAIAILEVLGMTERRKLMFAEQDERWDGTRDVVRFRAGEGLRRIDCAISLEALEDHFRWDVDSPIEVFRANRSAIEHRIRLKYLNGLLEPDGSVLLRSEDFG